MNLLEEITEQRLKRLKQLRVKEVETCCVVNQHCLSPANVEEPVHCKAKCFSCGQAVCTNCSDIRSYWQYGRVRLCDSCQIDYDGNNDRIVKKTLKLAGY